MYGEDLKRTLPVCDCDRVYTQLALISEEEEAKGFLIQALTHILTAESCLHICNSNVSAHITPSSESKVQNDLHQVNIPALVVTHTSRLGLAQLAAPEATLGYRRCFSGATKDTEHSCAGLQGEMWFSGATKDTQHSCAGLRGSDRDVVLWGPVKVYRNVKVELMFKIR